MKYGAEPSTPLGRYRLIALLGQGGMADVYLACTQGPRGFQKLLVVKLARFTGDPVFATMFLEEARIAAQLEHPNVVQTYEIAAEGSRHYIVMEYLDGGNLARLRQRAAKTGGIPLRISLTILSHVLEGLEYAHEARGLDGRPLKVVHRDLSPANIMVTAQGVVKILDFGIAKATDSYSFTQTGKFSGKLSYMPPEQMRGDPSDARADLFAFGVILAEAALNGKLWGNSSSPEIASRLGNNEIPSLDRGKPIDPDLRAICERALAPNREMRYPSAAELKVDLANYLIKLGGPVSQHELAQFVRTTIGDDRAELQAVIDSQLQKLSSSNWTGSAPIPELPRVEHTPSRTRSPSAITENTPSRTRPPTAVTKNEFVFEDSGQLQVITSESQVAPIAALRKLPAKLVALGAVLAVLLGVLVVLLIWPSPPPVAAPAPAPAPPVAAAPSPPPMPTVPSAPKTARLEIVVSPSDASMMLDGKPLGANPYIGAYPRDLLIHELVITAEGYQPLSHRFELDRDLEIHLSLNRLRDTASPSDPPRRIGGKPAPQIPARLTTTVAKPTARGDGRVDGKADPKADGKTDPKVDKADGKTDVKADGKADAKAETKPASPSKHGLDTDVYTKPSNKRSIDSNVLDEGSNKPKPTIDRNPWEN